LGGYKQFLEYNFNIPREDRPIDRFKSLLLALIQSTRYSVLVEWIKKAAKYSKPEMITMKVLYGYFKATA
jgi:hypothetical protein